MKLIYLSFITILLFSCQSNEKKIFNQTDSLLTIAGDTSSITDIVFLEDMFKFKNENELAQKFGKENITTDTIWGAEGMFYMGTKLFAKTPKEVIISWNDTLTHSKIVSLTVNCGYDNETGKYMLHKFWKSKTGISLGTSLKELVELNGKDFTFYGLGWDYGGEIISWNKGKLEKAGLAITLGTVGFDNQPDAYTKIVGDQEFSSSNPNAVKLNPVVLVLSAINSY